LNKKTRKKKEKQTKKGKTHKQKNKESKNGLGPYPTKGVRCLVGTDLVGV
jgi:hypothetical protein